MFDIMSTAVADTGTLELLGADDEPLFDRPARTEEERKAANRLSVSLYSPGSVVYQEADAERQNALTELVMKRNGRARLSSEERRTIDAVFHARITASFNHWTYPAGEGVTGFEMFKAAYLNPKIGFILDQVKKFAGDWGNFKAKSAAN